MQARPPEMDRIERNCSIDESKCRAELINLGNPKLVSLSQFRGTIDFVGIPPTLNKFERGDAKRQAISLARMDRASDSYPDPHRGSRGGIGPTAIALARHKYFEPCRFRGADVMTIRSRRETINFKHPARIEGIERLIPAGSYDVVMDEEMIEGLSFPSFRRVATMIMVPGAPPHHNSVEMFTITSAALADAQRRDKVASNA